nr:hypothetical protein [uncultured Holophaga sp.]
MLIPLRTTPLRKAVTRFLCRGLVPLLPRSGSDAQSILVISTDGLGDAFLRLGLVHALAQRHGAGQVKILTRASAAPLYRAMGLETLLYRDRCCTSPIHRLRLLGRLRHLGIRQIHVLNFICDEDLHQFFPEVARIGFSHRHEPGRDRFLTRVIPPGDYVGDALAAYGQATGLSGADMDNRQLLPGTGSHPSGRTILLAVGASNRNRMMRLENLAGILRHLLDRLPEAHFVMVGHGPRETDYARGLQQRLPGNRLESRVGQLGLEDLIQQVQGAALVIGFDSSVYNLAFTLRKPTLCLAGDNELVLHRRPWVKPVLGDGLPYGADDGLGCDRLNSVRPDQVLEAVLTLLPWGESERRFRDLDVEAQSIHS